MRVGAAVQPVINLLRDSLLESFIVHGDETEVQVLKEPGRRPQAKSYMWVQMTDGSGAAGTGPPIRLFGYRPSRSTETARALYEGMTAGGVLMSDGYEPYEVVAGQHERVHLGCWAHCRRYFFEALDASPKDRRGPEQLPARFIDLIGQLYHVEAQARREGLDEQALLLRRHENSSKRGPKALLTRPRPRQMSTTCRSSAKPTRQLVPSPGSIEAVRWLMRTMVPTTVLRCLSSKATFSPQRKSLRLARGGGGGSGDAAGLAAPGTGGCTAV